MAVLHILQSIYPFIGPAVIIYGAAARRWNWGVRWINDVILIAGFVALVVSGLIWWSRPSDWNFTRRDEDRLRRTALAFPSRFPLCIFPVEGSHESKAYAEKLLVAFRSAGWEPAETKICEFQTVNSDMVGLHVVASNASYSIENLPYRNGLLLDATALKGILADAGIETDPAIGSEIGLDWLESKRNQKGLVGIVVGIHP